MSYSNPYQHQQHYQQQHHSQQQQEHAHQQQSPYNGGYNNLPSLHEQSPYRAPLQPQYNRMPPPPQQLNTNLPLPPPQQLHMQQQTATEHYQQQQQQLPSMYDSRKLYTCNEPGCQEYFDQPGGLRIHQRTAHGRGPTMPNQQQVGGQQQQEDHMRTSQSRPYVCPYAECGKSFTQYGNLKTHSRKHTGERPYHCTYDGCDKAFTQLGNLKTHEKIHWPVKPFICGMPGCNKGFTQRGNLKTHQVKVHQIVPQ